MKKSLIAVVTALSLGTAFSHGLSAAKYGGIARSASDLGFELVTQTDGAALYLEDHGKPMATKGMSGKLAVLNGAEKTEAELKAAGGNKLEAKGLKLLPGAKVVATVMVRDKQAITVRFTVNK
jgi:hypothetical protein